MKSLLFLIISLFIVGCSHEQSHNEMLTKAERIIYTQPDSVVSMLAPCYSDTTMNDADRALYGLLYTEALHRSGLLTEADSLILFSRRYYENKGDKDHLSRTLLHHAIILYKQKQIHEAILTMKQAEHLAEDVGNPAFLWFLYSVMGDVNDNVGNYTQTLRYYKQALSVARKCRNNQWIVQTLNNIGSTFDAIGEKDSLKHYTDEAKPLVSKTDGEVRATYLVNLASYLLSKGKRKEAKQNLMEAMAISPTDRASKLLAEIYVEEGDTESAAQQWFRLTNSFSPDVAIESYRLLIDYLNAKGYKESASQYSQRLNEVYHSLYERNDVAGIIDLQTQYDEQQKERRQYRLTIMLLSAIIILIMIAIIIIRYSRQIGSELAKMRRQKEREQRENSREIKEVVSSLHASANKGKAADDEDANNLMQLSYANRPELRELLSALNSKEQMVCLLTIQNFLPTEIATLTISTPQTITNIRVRLLKKLFNETGGAKDFDNTIKRFKKLP
ncbi:MAG: hypothetical protein IJ647_05875 [Prevotella sp.]|nr:hypothetical protein [Prevotella sp.]